MADDAEDTILTEDIQENVKSLPPKWPETLIYTPFLRWEGIPREVRVHYEDEVDVLSIYVDVVDRTTLVNPPPPLDTAPEDGGDDQITSIPPAVETVVTTGDMTSITVVPKQNLQAGAWLCEVRGKILTGNQLRRRRRFEDDREGVCNVIFLYKYNSGKKFYVEPIFNSEMSQLRRLNPDEDRSQANLKIRRIHLEGRARAYLEILRAIEEREELIIDYDSDDDANFDAQTLPFSQTEEPDDIPEDSAAHKCSTAMLEDSEDVEFFEKPQTLQGSFLIDKVMRDGHPCKGQSGLFSLRKIHALHYIGEYTGDVVIHDPDNLLGRERVYESRYLMDFTNPYTGDDIVLKESWVDADLAGNELRFINDASGTGMASNVHFKRAWLGGKMHVICQATADISPGDELLVEYGDRYWENIHVDAEAEGDEAQEEVEE